MAIGGFNGNGGELTLSQFEQYVDKGQIHYYLASGGGAGGPGGGGGGGAGGPGGGGAGGARGGFGGAGGPGGGSSTSSITSWVESHFKSVEIGGQKVYDLTQPK